ncbi:hypothetical protein FRB99_006939 [Tulasnella sp. 403]|nr:hypothetical protein FRB99_006939 [Tulasnella sp. 403]
MAPLSIFATGDVVGEIETFCATQLEGSGDLYGWIQSLYLDLGGSSTKSIADLLVKFPALESFDVIYLGGSQWFRLDVPTLRSMTLYFPSWSFWPLCASQNLQSLKLCLHSHYEIVVDLVLHSLQQISHLRRLTVTLWSTQARSAFPVTQPMKTISLHLLQHLELGGLPFSDPKTLLKCIDAPDLTELVHESSGKDTNADWSDLDAKFLKVRKVRLHNWQKPFRVLSAILLCTPKSPQLEYLDIVGCECLGIDRTWSPTAMRLSRLCFLRVDDVPLE